MSDNLFEAKLNSELRSRTDLLQILARYVDSEDKDELDELLIVRETKGSIEIAEEVILPHFQSDKIIESKVVIIRPNSKIHWNKDIGDVKLVIAVLLKNNENDTILRTISQYTRKLADEEYLKYLMNTDKLNLDK